METAETVQIKTEPEDEQQPTVSVNAVTSEMDIKTEVLEESQTVVKSEIDIEPTIVGETQKLYDIERLRMFGDVHFIIKRMEPEDFCISYHNAVSSVETIMERLRRNQVPMNNGIGVRIVHHTPSSCLLVLAILNHKCHFYCTGVGMQSLALRSQLHCAGIDYLIANSHMPLGSDYFDILDTFLVCNEEYKLAKLNHIPTDSAPNATKLLPRNMCYTITTTGTTGLPKIIHVPYESIEPNIKGLSDKLNMSMADIIYLGTPCTFDPSVVELFLALHNGAAVLVSHHLMRDSPKRVLGDLFPSCITTPGITVLQMTPSVFRQFGVNAISEQILHNSSALRVLLLGGEEFPSSAELATWMSPEVLNQKLICNIYGITELSCWSTMHILNSIHERVPLGSPIDDQTVLRIQLLPNDHLNASEGCGELWLGSETRRCYIPEVDDATSNREGILYRATGDLVQRHPDGSILYEERANDVVKRAGNRISLGHITRKIEKCLHISDLAVCLWQQHMQKLICCIRSLEPKTKVQQRTQTFSILSRLMAAEQPDRFVYLQHFPCNAHGKLDKDLLLKESTLLAHSAQDILKNFLHDRLEHVDEEQTDTAPCNKKPRSQSLSSYSLSFRQAGGTSFHAITLCREIGLQMCIDDEQRHLFELLLDENVPLSEVLRFLDTAKLVAQNTKLKPVEPVAQCATSVTPTANSSLVIKRVEKLTIGCRFHWKAHYSKCIDSPVAQFDDRYVCVGAHSKFVRTLDAVTGKDKCTIKLSDRIECKVTFVSKNLAMVGCYDGLLYGFDPLMGSKLWNVDIGGMIKSQPFLSSDGSRVVICSYAKDYNVICLSMERQQVLWCICVGEKGIFATPLEIPRQQAIVVCTLDGHYARVSLLDGTMQWLQQCKKPIFSSPVLLDSSAGIFAVAEVAGNVHACDVNSGKILYTYAVDGDIFSSLVAKATPTFMGHSFLLFGSINQHVYCLRCKTSAEPKATIELYWRVNVGGSIYATPTIITMDPLVNMVFCCATNGQIVLINLSDGQIQYSDQVPGELFSAPCYIESLRRIYFGCRNNFLYCLGLQNHTKSYADYIRIN